MNYARVGEEFRDLALEHAWKVFGVLPLKNLRKNGVVVANETTGPDVYAAVIALHSVLNDSTERFYIATLSAFKLVKEPGQNVSTFSDNVLSVACHIDGISEHTVNDLHTLIYECYKGCSTKEFDCVTRNTWQAVKHTKEKIEPQGLSGIVTKKSMKAEIKRLTKIVKKGGGGATSNTNRLTTNRSTTYVCHWCGEHGHIKPNCPNLDKPQKGSGVHTTARSNAPSSNASSNKFCTKEGPKPGEPPTTTHKGTQYKWCETCKKWNSGAKAHHTGEHVKGRTSTTNGAANAALAQADSSHGATLSFMSGYIGMVDAEEAPFVVDDRTAFIKGETGHYSILSDDGTYRDFPSAVLANIVNNTSPIRTTPRQAYTSRTSKFIWHG
jgi:hypothetical protein